MNLQILKWIPRNPEFKKTKSELWDFKVYLTILTLLWTLREKLRFVRNEELLKHNKVKVVGDKQSIVGKRQSLKA